MKTINPWMFWWELWWRSAMAPFEAMAAASREPDRVSETATAAEKEGERHKEDFLVSRLRTELEVKGPQGIIDEGGRR